jgi:hypothetical protein
MSRRLSNGLPCTQTFGWQQYNSIGGNLKLGAMHRTASIFRALLKLDFFLGGLVVLLASFYIGTEHLVEHLVISGAGALAVLAATALGFRAVAVESHALMWVYVIVLVPLMPAYLGYKVSMQRLAMLLALGK